MIPACRTSLKSLFIKAGYIGKSWVQCNGFKAFSSKGLSHTTIFVQDGISIQELPLVVRNVSGKDAGLLFCESKASGTDETQKFSLHNDEVSLDEELLEIIEGFRRCSTTREVMQLLETVPSHYVQPTVAFYILKKMVELEQNKHHSVRYFPSGDVNFAESAVCSQLMDRILSNQNAQVFIDCLVYSNRSPALRKYLEPYDSKLHEKIMINVTGAKYSIHEMCTLIREYYFRKDQSSIDELWIGITEKANEINAKNISAVFQILPCLKTSRRMILNVLQKRITSVWWNIKAQNVADILAVLRESRMYSYRTLQVLARWLNTNIHTVTEEELLKIVDCLRCLDFNNTQTERALERYVRAKGEKMNSFLFASIMDYFLHFRIRSTNVLDKCSEHIIANGKSLSTQILKSMFIPFGTFVYHPPNGVEFWKIVETTLEEKFNHFSPEDVLDMLLSCVYLGKYPINFVEHVFDPYFLNRLESANKQNWNNAKAKLKILDKAMCLDHHYQKSLLPKDYSALPVSLDARVRRMFPKLKEHLLNTIGCTDDRIMSSFLPVNMPLLRIYLLDLLLVPEGVNNRYDVMRRSESCVAFLIHLPEHYCSKGHLLGPQVLRRKHLEKLGFSVIDLNFTTLLRFINSPKEMTEYLKETMNQTKE